ncbi:MAG: glycosyltransferase family 4 protein [Proteobacteria bacterium]|nr:glycosyltransferase family 4 protein [Pseudomonadota bacterium]
MNIALVSNIFPPDFQGGYDVLAGVIASDLRARGHDVQVLTTGTARDDDPVWVSRALALVQPFGQPAGLERFAHVGAAVRQAAVTRTFVDRHRPDVAVIMSLRRLGLHVPRTLAKLGVPTAWLLNDDWLLAHQPAPSRQPWRRAIARLLERGPLAARTWRGCDLPRALAPSAHIIDALRAGGAPLGDVAVCPQGVDLVQFRARAPRPMPAAPRMLFVGRLHPTKGCDVAIEALAQLRAGKCDARLSVAGVGSDEARLRAIAQTLGVEAAVDWLGFVAHRDLAAVYEDHDVFLFPSRWEEPAGLTYLEAMAVGLPVVAQATGGARELLRDRENALVVADADEMAAAVRRLQREPALTRALVTAGHELVREKANLARYLQTIEQLAQTAARAA